MVITEAGVVSVIDTVPKYYASSREVESCIYTEEKADDGVVLGEFCTLLTVKLKGVEAAIGLDWNVYTAVTV